MSIVFHINLQLSGAVLIHSLLESNIAFKVKHKNMH